MATWSVNTFFGIWESISNALLDLSLCGSQLDNVAWRQYITLSSPKGYGFQPSPMGTLSQVDCCYSFRSCGSDYHTILEIFRYGKGLKALIDVRLCRVSMNFDIDNRICDSSNAKLHGQTGGLALELMCIKAGNDQKKSCRRTLVQAFFAGS